MFIALQANRILMFESEDKQRQVEYLQLLLVSSSMLNHLHETNILSIVTGIKKEGRLPKIFDERPDSSIKIIVLDLRGNTDPNPANDSQHASKFKKMPKEIWDNVLQIGYAFQPNQPTDCPIQTSPTNTINIYTNILPKHPPPQPPQSQPFLPPQLMHNTMMNPYNNNNAGMFHPGMMYNNTNTMFNQSNYASVMAAAQSIVNAATAYNNMFVPTNYHSHHRLLSPQPTPMLSPHQQQMQYIQAQPSPQPANTQIKRKPVQFQPKPTNYLSPQIEQRLQRKKTVQQQQQQPPPPPQVNKKKVRFAEKPDIKYFEREEGEDAYNAEEEEGYDDEIVIEDSDQVIVKDYPYYYHDNEQRYNDDEEEEAYYTQQQQHYHPHRSYQKSSRGAYFVYEEEDDEEDHGDLWKRRSFITRHNSKYKSRV